ncbi:MAG: SDR family NAD(P)-dependent oxidoreductase [Myxococcota bacterium]|nr:SDR family NAD(P)-dependent oxidoreductase [Myxococcota bacterium]
MNYYKNKTILITGAFGGFGKHFINQLIESGANVVLSDVAAPPISQVVKKPHLEKQIIATITADLSTAEGCEYLYEACKKASPHLDIIIHNAGILFTGRFVDIPLKINEKIMRINLLSVMRLNSLFLPDLLQRQSGHLIYVSSVAGYVATPYGAAYSTSKFGMRGFAMAVHGEVKKQGIKTSIVYPFWSKTPIMKKQVFGNPEMSTMPNFFASEPEYVIRHALRSAARGKLHIRPGFFSKLMWHAVRLMPVIAKQRFMKQELIQD